MRCGRLSQWTRGCVRQAALRGPRCVLNFLWHCDVILYEFPVLCDLHHSRQKYQQQLLKSSPAYSLTVYGGRVRDGTSLLNMAFCSYGYNRLPTSDYVINTPMNLVVPVFDVEEG